jgi:cytochrome P450
VSAGQGNGGVHPGLDEAELSMFLLFAGHETTVVQIGFTALLLMANPEQWGHSSMIPM